MYSHDDFFSIFNYLKDNPDQSDISALNAEQMELEKLNQMLYNIQIADKIDRKIEIANSYIFILEMGSSSINNIKNQIAYTLNELYKRVEFLTDKDNIINEINTYIIELQVSRPDTSVTSEIVEERKRSFVSKYGIDPNIIAIAINMRNETKQLFKNIIDQISFNTDDYNRLRKFIIDWYASFRTFIKLQEKTSDAFLLSEELLEVAHKSFGFENVELIDKKTAKAALLLALVEIYKKKGTPDSIIEVLTFMDIDDIVIYEWWLYRDRSLHGTGNIYLTGKPIATKHTNGDNDIEDRFMSFSEFKNTAGPNWYYTEEHIKEIDDKLEGLSLPSILPYFSISAYVEFITADVTFSFFNKYVNDQLIDYLQNTINTDYGMINVESFDQSIEFITLYAAMLYTYDRYNDEVKYQSVKSYILGLYRIDIETHNPNPFIGTYPFKYEKSLRWLSTHARNESGDLFDIKSYQKYPPSVEIYLGAIDISQDNNDVSFDTSIPGYFDAYAEPYLRSYKDSLMARIRHFNNTSNKNYDPNYKLDYVDIQKEYFEPFIKNYNNAQDLYIVVETEDELPLMHSEHKIGDYAVVIRDSTASHKVQLYQSISKTGSLNDQWNKITDDGTFEEWIYHKILQNRKDLVKEWSRTFDKNFCRNRLDIARLLNGTFPNHVLHKSNLPIINNNIGDIILVQFDETHTTFSRPSDGQIVNMPRFYKCINTTGSIDEQWESDNDGMYKYEIGLNSSVKETIDNIANDNYENLIDLCSELVDYIDIFINTNIQETTINIAQIFLGNKLETNIRKLINEFKPKRARLLSYELLYRIKDPTQDSIVKQDKIGFNIGAQISELYKEGIRNTNELTYDTGRIYDNNSIVDDNIEIEVTEGGIIQDQINWLY